MAQEFTLVERVKEILPEIESRRFETEKLRMAHPDNIKLLKEIGYTRAFQPKKWGGMEVSLREFCEATALLAGACGGTTWAAQLLNTHQHQLALFSEQAQIDVWGDDPLATASSSIAPFGKTEEVDGGVMFSGDLTWSSGCDHAEWAICGFLREGAEVNPKRHQHFALIPRSDYDIIDDWHAMAMKGSGTKTLSIKNVFVPEHRIQSICTSVNDGAIRRLGHVPRFRNFLCGIPPLLCLWLFCHQLRHCRKDDRMVYRTFQKPYPRLHRRQRWPRRTSVHAFG